MRFGTKISRLTHRKSGKRIGIEPAASHICQKSLRILKALRHKAGIFGPVSSQQTKGSVRARDSPARGMVLEPIIPQKAW
jgi:hypothetical protein